MNPSPKPLHPPCSSRHALTPNPQPHRLRVSSRDPGLRLSITGLPSLFEMKQTRTATCSGTQPAIELDFGLPPLPKKAWRARAFLPGLASHKRRRSVQKKRQKDKVLSVKCYERQIVRRTIKNCPTDNLKLSEKNRQRDNSLQPVVSKSGCETSNKVLSVKCYERQIVRRTIKNCPTDNLKLSVGQKDKVRGNILLSVGHFFFGFFFALWILAIWVNPAALAI